MIKSLGMYVVLAFSAAPTAGPQAGQKPGAKASPAATRAGTKQAGLKPVVGPVELKAQPPHVHGQVEAFPLVLAGPAVTQAVADKINASLRREQATVDAAAEDCRVNYKEQMHQAPAPDAWQRSIDVTFKGPRYLGLLAEDSYFCGGAYPDGGSLPLVYDLTTGSPVNWVKLFPAGARAERATGSDGSVLGAIVWPVLSRRAIHGATGECDGAYSSDSTIQWAISLDAREGKLQADAYDVAHAIRNCEDIEPFSPTEMRKLGFAKELADAVEAAHTLQR